MFISLYQYRKCLCLSCICGTGRGKVFLAAGMDYFFFNYFFCLGTGKGEVYFSVEGDEGRSVSRATSCFQKANTRGLHGFLNEGCAP